MPDRKTADVMAGFRKLMPVILKGFPGVVQRGQTKPKQMVTDSEPAFASKEFTAYLKELGIVHRMKVSSNREELQSNSILDAALKKIQEILQERRKDSRA